MADTSGMQDLRGIDIDRLAKGFADEDIIFKRFVTNSTTSAREIRWYQKTSGFLTISGSMSMGPVAEGALPFVTEQSWTRNTSYVKKFILDSPMMSMEDIRDTDIDLLAGNLRDLTRAISYKVDTRIWNVLTEDQVAVNINLVNCSGATWNSSGADPITDIMSAKQKIRAQGYDPEGGSLLLNSTSHQYLLTWLINTKGSSIPAFAAARVGDGVVMEILGLRVSVSENVTSGFGLAGNLARACTWKSFVPITARTIEEIGIGTKIRVWEEGEALLTDPKAVCMLSGCA